MYSLRQRSFQNGILIKNKLVDLIEGIFQREGFLYIAYNARHAFLPQTQLDLIIYGLVRKRVKLSPFY